jgi:hypothetical protein
MEAPDPHGGGVLHAPTGQPSYVASRLAEAPDTPDTPTPNRWRPETLAGPLGNEPSLGIAYIDQQERRDPQELEGLSRTPSRASEARTGIQQRKASQRGAISKPKHKTPLLEASKQAQALLGALQTAQTQQEVAQDSLEQLRTQLAEELNSWKAEQQAREGLYMERIAKLETEVSRLRTELTEAKQVIQRSSTRAPPALMTSIQPSHTNQRAENQASKPRATNPPPKPNPTFADLAALLATKPGGQEWQEVSQRKKKHQKAKQAETSNLRPAKDCPKEARRLLFRREGPLTAPRSEREDIILAVNRGLAKEGFPGFIRAVDAGYTQTGSVTVLLERGALGTMLLPSYRDSLVAAARQADPAIISAELPEQWYRLKVHGVPIRRYLGCGLALAREEIELGTEFRLKRDPTWLRGSRELQNSTKKGSTIVITVGSLEEARKLLVNGIRFGGSRYKAEHYWEVRVDTVCPRCCHLGHRSFKACGDHPPCCFICAGPHEGNEHVCRVVDCRAKPGVACQHMPAKCGNCGGPHTATAANCPAKREARQRWKSRDTTQAPRNSHESTTPSSPWYTVLDRSQPATRARSSSALTSPRTPRGQRPSSPTLGEAMDLGEDQTPQGATDGLNDH